MDHSRHRLRTFCCLINTLASLFCAGNGFAQAIRGEAYVGQPFGVGKIELEVVPEILPSPLGLDGLLIRETNGRVHYPVISGPPLGGVFADFVGVRPRATIYFLFRDQAPLEIELQSRAPVKLLVTPVSDPRRAQRLFRTWWREYSQPPGLLESKPDYPPLVSQYLRLMLSQRLGLPPRSKSDPESWEAYFRRQLGLTLSSETLRLQLMESRFTNPTAFTMSCDRPLPTPWNDSPLPVEVADSVEIEPMASHIPVESLYCRFGSFRNFLWLQDTLARWGGDVQNLVALRSLNYGVNQRIENQLVLRQSALSRLFGETVVADVAIVGFDLYFQEGPSFGLVFQAKNNTFFQANLVQQRQERLKQGGAREEKLTILGHSVSYMTSDDGAVRSYYVADGDFHLVASSRKLVERFLEAGQGKGRLSDSKEFRLARSLYPVSRPDVTFVYLSRDFFRHLVSPAYRIETQRRLQALTDMDLVELALLAAAAEGVDAKTVEELVSLRFLPAGFGSRSDGSRAVIEDGVVRDSLRGYRGAFTPIADVPVTNVSQAEEQLYRDFVAYYASEWRRLDPMMVAIQRKSEGNLRERILIDARVTPLAKENYERLLTRLGPPDRQQLAPIEGDLGRFEIILNKGRLFGGLYDIVPPVDIVEGRIVPTGRLRDILIGYVGTTGELGWLGRVNQTLSRRPDSQGYTRGLFGLWRREMPGMTIFSFQPEILSAVSEQLHWTPAERDAHARLYLGDLSRARLTPLLNRFVYWRTQQTSLGNLRFLRDLEQQLYVPGKNCKTVAEFLYNAQLKCPLGGEYVYQPDEYGVHRWTSTAFVSTSAQPRGRRLPVLLLPFGRADSGGNPAASSDSFFAPADEQSRGRLQAQFISQNETAVAAQNQLPAADSEQPQTVEDTRESPSGNPPANADRAPDTTPIEAEGPAAGFLAPPLNWFRGLTAEAVVTPEAVTAHLEILMEWPKEK